MESVRDLVIKRLVAYLKKAENGCERKHYLDSSVVGSTILIVLVGSTILIVLSLGRTILTVLL
jgi:hypothetical protein